MDPRRRDAFSEFDDDLRDDDLGIPGGDPNPHEEPRSGGGADDRQRTISQEELDRVREERDKARGDYDSLVRKMLFAPEGAEQQQTTVEDDDTPPPGWDKEEYEVMKPLLAAHGKKVREETLAEVEQRLGPVLQHAAREASIADVEARVPGFAEHLMSEVEQEFNGMSPEERNRYKDSVGVEAVALRRKLARAERIIQAQAQAGGGSPLAGMAHSASFSPNPPARGGDKYSDENIWDLSDDEFDALENRILHGG